MEAKVVLLLNATVILLISFGTDYWILLRIRQIPPPSTCDVIPMRQMTWLCCGNASYALVEQHTNLYRQCNDMTGYSPKLKLRREITSELKNAAKTNLGPVIVEKDIDGMHHVANSYTLPRATGLSAIHLENGVSYVQVGQLEQLVFRFLIATVILYTLSILTTFYILHMTNIRTPINEAHAMYYCEVGWSLICACIAVVLTGIASYIFIMEHRCARERQLSIRRRKQIHNAIMSSCREEVAMAIRARMTVL